MNKLLNKLLFVSAFVGCLTGCTFNFFNKDTKKETETLNPDQHTTGTYTNVVFSRAADPSVIRAADGKFYAYVTADSHSWIPGKAPFQPNGPILVSDDMVNWEYCGQAFEEKPNWIEGGSIWAPDIVYRNNKYYYYYALAIWGGLSGIGVGVSDYPYGPFEDLGMILDDNTSGNDEAIDPCVVEDDDGRVYMFYGSFGGVDRIELASDGVSLLHPDNIELDIVRGVGFGFEGTYVRKMHGSWYMMGSEGSCCSGSSSTYHVVVYKSDTLTGVYKASTGKKSNVRSSIPADQVIMPSAECAGPGHHSILQDDDGVYWIVYHGYDIEHPNGRQLCIDQLWFNEETKMPYVKDFKSTMGTATKAPYVEKK